MAGIVIKPFWTLFLISLTQGGLGLILTDLVVPQYVLEGQSARLACLFKLNPMEQLYTVKWYKSGNEFYRFLPRETTQVQVFPVPGVYVNLAESNRTVVSLLAADLETTGRYRCEVSAEAPSFDTQSDYADLVVVVLPDTGPAIIGGRDMYKPGEHVQLTCKSAPSRPAQSLTWFINGEHVNRSYLRGPTIKKSSTGLESSELKLQFWLKPTHFREGVIKLKCSATIATVYWNSKEEQSLSTRQEPRAPLSSRADRVLASPSEENSSRRSTLSTSLFATCLLLRQLLPLPPR